jgi:hypothetical protein
VWDREEEEKTRSIVLCALCLLNVIVFGGTGGRARAVLKVRAAAEKNNQGLRQLLPN